MTRIMQTISQQWRPQNAPTYVSATDVNKIRDEREVRWFLNQRDFQCVQYGQPPKYQNPDPISYTIHHLSLKTELLMIFTCSPQFSRSSLHRWERLDRLRGHFISITSRPLFATHKTASQYHWCIFRYTSFNIYMFLGKKLGKLGETTEAKFIAKLTDGRRYLDDPGFSARQFFEVQIER